MNSTLSHESCSRVMLAELLLTEKDATRVWLRAEMDRLVDPMLDSIFDRLTIKLTNGLERTQSGDGLCVVMGNHDGQLEPPQGNQPLFLIAQPSTSSHFIQQHQNVHHSNPQTNGLFVCNENSNQTSHFTAFLQPTMSTTNVQVNFEPLSNELMEQAHTPPPLSSTIENEQNCDGEDEDGGICECEECLYGIEIDTVNEDGDDSDSVQWIDDEQELAQSVKKPRMESTQPNNAQSEVVRQSTDEIQPNQVNKQDKQIITISLKCPESDCHEAFTTNAHSQLTQHMWNAHSIRQFRCQVKDCVQSFDNHAILREHIKVAHKNTIQWHCEKCPKHFSDYKHVNNHNRDYHQLGNFQCSFPSCTFTGEYRRKLYKHYESQHKPDLVCQQSGCNYRTKESVRFKAHQRAHLGIKPYRCKWPNCHYSSASQNNAMTHINRIHFNPKTNPSDVALSGKPTDYLDVVHSLL